MWKYTIFSTIGGFVELFEEAVVFIYYLYRYVVDRFRLCLIPLLHVLHVDFSSLIPN